MIEGLNCLESVPRRYLSSVFQQDAFKYKQCTEEEFRSHNIFDKASDIFFQLGPIKLENLEFRKEVEQLDQLVVSIRLKAKIKCCQSRTKFD